MYFFFFLVSLRPLSRSLQLIITYCTLHPLSSHRSVLIKNSPTSASPWLKSRSPELTDPRRLAGTLTPFHPPSFPPSFPPSLSHPLFLSLFLSPSLPLSLSLSLSGSACEEWRTALLSERDSRLDSGCDVTRLSPSRPSAVLRPATHTHTHTHAHTDEHTLLLVQYPRWMHTHGVTFHPSNTPEQIISVHVSATHSGMPVTLSVNLSHIYMKLLTREIYPFPPAVAAAALICSQCSLDPWMNPRCSFGIMIRHTAYAETMTCPTYTITNDEWNLENRFFGGKKMWHELRNIMEFWWYKITSSFLRIFILLIKTCHSSQKKKNNLYYSPQWYNVTMYIHPATAPKSNFAWVFPVYAALYFHSAVLCYFHNRLIA